MGHKDDVEKELQKALKTLNDRHDTYGETSKIYGDVIACIFKGGVSIKSREDFRRFNLFSQILIKLIRYSNSIEGGGHYDSAHDIINYAAMLAEVTDETKG